MGTRTDLFKRDPYEVLVTDFFGSVRPVELVYEVQRENYITEEAVDKTSEEIPKIKTKYFYVPQFPVVSVL